MLQTQQLAPLPTPTTPPGTTNSNEPMSDQWPTVNPGSRSAQTTLDMANRNSGGGPEYDPSHMSSADQSPADRTHHPTTHQNSSHELSKTASTSTSTSTTTDPYEYLPTPPTTPLDSPDGSGSLTPKLPTPATATYSASTFNATVHMAVEANTTSTGSERNCAAAQVGTVMMMPLTIFSLPNETLDRIFSFIPPECLPTVMRAHSRCHVLAERLLYYKIQHIHLFEPLCEEEEEDEGEGGNRANNMNQGGSEDSYYGSFGNGDTSVNGDSARRRSGNNNNSVVGGVTALGVVDDDWRGGGATTTTPPRSRPARNKHWQCLWTLASRRSAASAVRHFAIKGLHWVIQSGGLDLISRVVSSLDNLYSFQLDVHPQFERALLLTNPKFSSHLCAVNVSDPLTALYICNAPAASGEDQPQAQPQARGGAHADSNGTNHVAVSRPITTLRIGYNECPLDAEMMASLLTALTSHSPSITSPPPPVQRLQVPVWCESVAGLVRILDMIAKQLPFLVTLGIYICSPRPIVAERSQDLTRDIAKALAPLTQLQTLSLASLRHCLTTTKEDADIIAKECQQIRLVELNWSAWGLDQDPSRKNTTTTTTTTTTGATSEWKSLSGHPNFHPFIRRRWVYEHAYIS